MKKWIGAVLAGCGVAGAALVFLGSALLTEKGPLTADKILVIDRGIGTQGIAEKLAAEGITTSKWTFMAEVVLSRSTGKLQAGEYEFLPGMSVRNIVKKLATGDVYHRRITIPEGLTSYEIVSILKASPNMGGEVSDVPKDGTLMPDTYEYASGENRNAKIAQMQKAMSAYLEKAWPARDPASPLKTPAEALVLASIVEKETGLPAERKRIAGVFFNRLKIGMKLQSDPTVIYALTNGQPQNTGQGPLGRPLLAKDLLGTDSPYNTYLYEGLPPAPIANPGRAAIDAVLHPEPNDFLYFVADGTGGHVFARTLAEHNTNVAHWRAVKAKP